MSENKRDKEKRELEQIIIQAFQLDKNNQEVKDPSKVDLFEWPEVHCTIGVALTMLHICKMDVTEIENSSYLYDVLEYLNPTTKGFQKTRDWPKEIMEQYGWVLYTDEEWDQLVGFARERAGWFSHFSPEQARAVECWLHWIKNENLVNVKEEQLSVFWAAALDFWHSVGNASGR